MLNDNQKKYLNQVFAPIQAFIRNENAGIDPRLKSQTLDQLTTILPTSANNEVYEQYKILNNIQELRSYYESIRPGPEIIKRNDGKNLPTNQNEIRAYLEELIQNEKKYLADVQEQKQKAAQEDINNNRLSPQQISKLAADKIYYLTGCKPEIKTINNSIVLEFELSYLEELQSHFKRKLDATISGSGQAKLAVIPYDVLPQIVTGNFTALDRKNLQKVTQAAQQYEQEAAVKKEQLAATKTGTTHAVAKLNEVTPVKWFLAETNSGFIAMASLSVEDYEKYKKVLDTQMSALKASYQMEKVTRAGAYYELTISDRSLLNYLATLPLQKPLDNVQPIILHGASQSIGATASILLPSGISRESAQKAEGIAMTQLKEGGGLALYFPSREYAEKLAYALQERGIAVDAVYVQPFSRFNTTYDCAISFKTDEDIRRFILDICHLNERYIIDMYRNSGVKSATIPSQTLQQKEPQPSQSTDSTPALKAASQQPESSKKPEASPLDQAAWDPDKYKYIISESTYNLAHSYRQALIGGSVKPGPRLASELAHVGTSLKEMSDEQFLECLINTKKPMLFAEAEIEGYYKDWNTIELQLLGSITYSSPVVFYDTGEWGRNANPTIFSTPLAGNLIFVPGALLNDKNNGERPDRQVIKNGKLDENALYALYKERILPGLINASAEAGLYGKKAFVTLPGIGCGEFCDENFKDVMPRAIERVIARMLSEHANDLPNLQGIYFDSWEKGTTSKSRKQINGINFLVGPSQETNLQLTASPVQFNGYLGGQDDHFEDCIPYSIVAWDHASLQGNDAHGNGILEDKRQNGRRYTNDGAMASLSNSMFKVLGVQGAYIPPNEKGNNYDTKNRYMPPEPYKAWAEVIREKNIRVKVAGHLHVQQNGQVLALQSVKPKVIPLPRINIPKQLPKTPPHKFLDIVASCLELEDIYSAKSSQGNNLFVGTVGVTDGQVTALKETLTAFGIKYELKVAEDINSDGEKITKVLGLIIPDQNKKLDCQIAVKFKESYKNNLEFPKVVQAKVASSTSMLQQKMQETAPKVPQKQALPKAAEPIATSKVSSKPQTEDSKKTRVFAYEEIRPFLVITPKKISTKDEYISILKTSLLSKCGIDIRADQITVHKSGDVLIELTDKENKAVNDALVLLRKMQTQPQRSSPNLTQESRGVGPRRS